MAVRCAILDDYQNVVLKVADWSKVNGDVDVTVFNEHLGGPDEVIARAAGLPHRRRHARAHRLSAQAVIEALPDLKLLITTGMRNASIDIAAAKARGVTVCGTGPVRQPDHRHRLGPDPRADPPDRLRERAAPSRRRLADARSAPTSKA